MNLLKVSMLLLFCFTASTPVQAQWFPKAPWNKTQASSGCVNGVCPVARAVAAVATSPIRAAAVVARYPSVSTSYGSLQVGTVLEDGAIVTSVGVTVSQITSPGVCDCCCPDCKCNQSVEAFSHADPNGPNIGDRARLIKVMLAAGREAKAAGASTEAIKAAMVDAAVTDLAVGSKGIDIDKWIAIIEKLIPLIMKLIDLFTVIPLQVGQQAYFFHDELPLTI